jgi:hypothetical protein
MSPLTADAPDRHCGNDVMMPRRSSPRGSRALARRAHFSPESMADIDADVLPMAR